MAELDINRKVIPIGEVAYFIKNDRYKPGAKIIDYGIVEEHYHSEIVLQLYEVLDRRTINGIPIKEFETPTDWKKLPKGWTYNTELFTLDFEDFKSERAYEPFDMTNPSHIKDAISEGILVKVQENDHCHIEAEIDNKKGYRIVRNYPMFDYNPTYVTRPHREVYATYEEAKAEVEKIEKEYQRIANLSDYEWSLEHIEKNINKAIRFEYITEEKADEIRKRISDLGNVEDMETRVSKGTLQWKYWKEKRWKSFM